MKNIFNISVRGPRVLAQLVKEEKKGVIWLPESRTITFEFGRVVDCGDGKYPLIIERKFIDDRQEVMFTKEGDYILFQLPAQVRNSSMYKLKNEEYCFLHQGDIVAVVNGANMSYDNFKVAGDWLLLELRVNKTETSLQLPDDATIPLEDFRFKVVQKGHTNPDEWNIGDEVFVERQRCNPIKLDVATGSGEGEAAPLVTLREFVFVHKAYVYGVRAEHDLDTTTTRRG